MKSILAIALAVAVAAEVAGCSTDPPGSHAAPPLAGASPASQATVTGSCVTGILDETTSVFWPLSSTSDAIGSDDYIAEAYQLTLTDTGAAPAAVTGFAVAFYTDSSGQEQETTSDDESLDAPAFITAGQSQTWTETPWNGYSANEASVGPYAAGVAGAIDPTATCDLVQWQS